MAYNNRFVTNDKNNVLGSTTNSLRSDDYDLRYHDQ